MALASETTSLAFLSFILFAIFHAGFVQKVNAEEVLDPVRMANQLANPVPEKKFDSFLNGFGEAKRSFDEIDRSSFGFNKRPNFDEIGRSSFGFNKRRNFDEIGRSAFGFTKRLPYGFLTGYDGAAKQNLLKRANFDEIGRSSFGFYRRSPVNSRSAGWRFFSGFGKRNVLPNYDDVQVDDTTDTPAQKRGFDEISRSSFGFTRR